ncbi:MAG TPA: hypothetical protein VMH88_00085 [Gemmatimonadales bacterium]|nr:hypothetical protein [Gemmatimonadales bacterium]
MTSPRPISIACTAIAAVALACTKKAPPPPAAAAPAVVRITATDFAFAAPDTVPAGVVTVVVVNQGKEPHQAVILRLAPGKTVADFQAGMRAMAKKPGGPPPWSGEMGGPNAALPGDSSNATQVLQPGSYVLVCFIPSTDGMPHVMKGMFRSLTVSGSPVAAPEEPAADIVVTMTDYAYALSKPVTAGAHTFRVDNAGAQHHELLLVALAPGKKVKDFYAYAEGGMKGPPPFTRVAGVGGLDAGAHASFSATLPAGAYGMVCFLPDVKDGKPHGDHGMLFDFTVN